MLTQIEQDFPKDVRVVYRHFPLPSHDKSLLAAQGAEAAGLQGKFWEMHDLLFKEQANWAVMTVADFKTWLLDQSTTLGLDKARFSQDLASPALVEKVKQAQADARKAKVIYTPYLVINGRVYTSEQLPLNYPMITEMIKLIQLEDKQSDSCPPLTVDAGKQYTARLKTEKGDIIVQLFPDKAPMAVNSFIYLAKKGWFDGITFYRVLPGVLAQTGDPSETGFGGPGYTFGNEISDLKFDKEGMLGMANAGPDANGSNFFITLAPAADLNGSYTIFGQVIQGMDVVKKLTPRNPQQGVDLVPGDKINEVVITEN